MTHFTGDFHFQMHLCHALYRLGGEQYLLPMAHAIGFKHLLIDFPLDKWNKQDQFLLLFCDAFTMWFQSESYELLFF